MNEGLTPEQAKKRVEEILQRELTAPNDEKLVDVRRTTKSAALNMLEDTVLVGRDNEQQKPISFKDATIDLQEAGFDLVEARKEAVRLHEEWGLVKALQKTGVVGDVDEYNALFDNVTFTQKGIYELLLRLEAGEKWMPIFNPGNFELEELWKLLISDANIPYSQYAEGYLNLSHLREIDQKSMRRLVSIDQIKNKSQPARFRDALEKAYDNAQEVGESVPGVSFTRDQLEVTNVNKTVIQHWEEILKGEQFIDPINDLIRWRTQFQLQDKKPDSKCSTIYPNYMFDFRNVLELKYRLESPNWGQGTWPSVPLAKPILELTGVGLREEERSDYGYGARSVLA